MGIEVMSKDKITEADRIANLAVQQKLETGKVTVVCPKCHNIPNTVVEGDFNEYMMVKCPCGYIKMMHLGI
jgi:Zn finger protein HypA/HybF involved in hydrogenase expression